MDMMKKIKEKLNEIEEKDWNPQIPVIYHFIANELEVQKSITDTMADDHNKDWNALNQIFYET